MSIKLDTFRKENLTQKEKNTKNINLNKKKMNFDKNFIYYKFIHVHLIQISFLIYFLFLSSIIIINLKQIFVVIYYIPHKYFI